MLLLIGHFSWSVNTWCDGIFTKQLKSIDCWQLPAPVRSSMTSTHNKSKPTSSFDHYSVSFICSILALTASRSLFVRNQAIFSNCEVPGHWWLPLPPVGKWKISVACNKYFSVGCLCVYVSIAPKLSLLLLPVLLSFEFFVSLSRLYFSIIPHSSIMIKTDRYFGG